MGRSDFGAGQRHLHHNAYQRFVQAKPGHRADHALAADGGGLDRLAVAQHREQRQHAGMREVDLVDLVAGLQQHHALLQGERGEVRQQPVEITARQGGEQLVVQGKTGVWQWLLPMRYPARSVGPIYRRGEGMGAPKGGPRKPCL